jgi:hypothetical protein
MPGGKKELSHKNNLIEGDGAESLALEQEACES